jgi:hypothetical protein
MAARSQAGPVLRVIETVSCLACGTVYAKPRLGGTAVTNPGCPNCEYLGWSAVTGVEEPERHHFYADPRQTRPARPH